MCGISGFCDFTDHFLTKEPYYEKLLREMGETLAHRGKDSSGEFLREHIGLSHARLSIRDITGGALPMTRNRSEYTQAHEYAILYYGKIYNTGELIPEL